MIMLYNKNMNKQVNRETRIFLDSGNPEDTKEFVSVIDGQTTNPSLIKKSTTVQNMLKDNNDVTEDMLLDMYRDIVIDMRNILGPSKSISIEVYADDMIEAETMIEQGRYMNTWIPDAHIKLPITHAGLLAAKALVSEGISVNMTLCFSQEQALAVHYATKGAQPGQVFISPFIGRLDDIGVSGIDLVKNILLHYRKIESHVQVLAASIRSVEHMEAVVALQCDLMTVPAHILKQQADTTFVSGDLSRKLNPIAFEDLPLDLDWQEYPIQHDLTDAGLIKFASDWKSLVSKEHE